MTSSSTSSADPATIGDITALADDMNIFWLLFGAILVFCESSVWPIWLGRRTVGALGNV